MSFTLVRGINAAMVRPPPCVADAAAVGVSTVVALVHTGRHSARRVCMAAWVGIDSVCGCARRLHSGRVGCNNMAPGRMSSVRVQCTARCIDLVSVVDVCRVTLRGLLVPLL